MLILSPLLLLLIDIERTSQDLYMHADPMIMIVDRPK